MATPLKGAAEVNDDMLKDEGRKAYACTNSEEIAWWGATADRLTP